MKVHVLAYKNYCGHVCVRAVFTDANLELAEDYAELFCEDDAVMETIEVDDPEDIAALNEDIRELCEEHEECNDGNPIPEVAS
jgi:hypothetical protein